jgi:sec-independent protein translocase protein TatA
MFGLGFGEIALIVLAILVLFGAGKLPQIMGQLGIGIKEFKKAVKDDTETQKTDKK